MLALCSMAFSCAAADKDSDKEVVKVDLYVTVPADTDPDATIYLAGDLPQVGGWKADGVAMKRVNGEPVYHAQLEVPRGAMLEYKVTRGSWDTVEKGAAGEELRNRTLKADRNLKEQIKVAKWRSETDAPTAGVASKSTISGDVRIHELESKILRNRRRLLVWLPPEYEKNPNARYPVLYMHDGQNLFDDATSFAGEWHADEIAQGLIEQGKVQPIIMVGIENTWQRVMEYTPGGPSTPGKADLYAKMVVEEVKPFIDSTYRTKPDRDNTGVAGSSLGGLVSLYMLKTYPSLFGRCAALSPSLWWEEGQFIRDAAKDCTWARDTRIWLDIGTAEHVDAQKAREVVVNCDALAEVLRASGLKPGRDYIWRPIEGADHNEQAWAERFDEVLIFLYSK